MQHIKLEQDNHDKIKVTTTETEITEVVKQLYRWRKDIFNRFKNMGSSDYDRVIYHIYLKQRKENYNY
jgi:hypothetical protein